MMTNEIQETRESYNPHTPALLTLGDNWSYTTVISVREILPLGEQLAAEMAAQGYCPEDMQGMRHAVEEATANALEHGHHNDPNKRVLVGWSVARGRVLAEVQDQGDGFDPRNVPDPTEPENVQRLQGRGVFLIRHFTSWARYDESGNRVLLCKYPSAPLPAA